MSISGVSNIDGSSGSYNYLEEECLLSISHSDSLGNLNSCVVMDSHHLGNISCLSPKSILDDFDSCEDIDSSCSGDISCPLPKAIENKKASFGIKPSNYVYWGSKENYLIDYLLDIVNREGKPPLLLRPLAALLALFGIHGFGQTNCASCATAVAETLEKNDVYLAMPKLRGADVKGIMGPPVNSGMSVNELLIKLQQLKSEDELNAVIVVNRPASWQWLPGATQGHACNLIKFKDSDTLHFLDVQKKIYLSCDLDLNQGVGPLEQLDQIEFSYQEAQISKFLCSIGADGIDLYEKKIHKEINRRPELDLPA